MIINYDSARFYSTSLVEPLDILGHSKLSTVLIGGGGLNLRSEVQVSLYKG